MKVLGTWVDEDNSDPRVHIVEDDAGWLRVVCTGDALMQIEHDNIHVTRGATCTECKRNAGAS